jgi:trehalose/maltose hydrolase-like predicted phosphorylase
VQRILNLHAFHLLQTLSPHVADRDVGMGARGLHGEAYEGHVFWDDVFALPLVSLRDPDVARGSLLYRYRRLRAARRSAGEAGHAGAMYPWQSGSDGREETPTQLFNPHSDRWMPDNSRRQRHVGLAIAYNVWRYHEATGDLDFLRAHGAEMLVEIARFFASLAEFDPHDGRHHIRGVMGPDEFHDGYPGHPGSGLADSAYTNLLVSWVLGRAVELHRLLSGPDGVQLWQRLLVDAGEVARWDEIGRTLSVPFLEDGVIAQFDGYADLAELDWASYRERYSRIGRLDLILDAESDNTNNYRVTKQADVVMLLQLFTQHELIALLGRLGYELDPAALARTIDHYLARTTHGSTLSRVAHAWALAPLDDGRSWELFREALQSDIADTQGGTTREGVHLGVMAGTVDMLVRCYLGVRARGEVLWFEPCLPGAVQHVEFRLRHRGVWLDVEFANGMLIVRSPASHAAAVRVGLIDRVVDLAPGDSAEVRIRPTGGS